MVDSGRIEAIFADGRRHRAELRIPYQGRKVFNSLCVVGQNPSDADKEFADKTVRYIEELIYKNYPQFSQIVMLNLFSRVDKGKSELNDLLNEQCKHRFENTVNTHENVLFIYGQLKLDGAYNFPQRARDIRRLFDGKKLWKLDIGKKYAPHPRNSAINFQNFEIKMCKYDFCDI